MPFSRPVREEALVRSGRRCCVCHRWLGVKVEVHHIKQEADGGANTIENAIVLCFDCHADAGHYNPRHPRGTKYTPQELRKHRDSWWEWYRKNPHAPMPNDEVTVNPSMFWLYKGTWQVHPTIRLHNKSDDIYYRLSIKFKQMQPNMTFADFSIRLRESSNDEWVQTVPNGARMNTSSLSMSMVNPEGFHFMIFLIPVLYPKEVRIFDVEHMVPREVAEITQAKIVVTIDSINLEPPEMLSMEVPPDWPPPGSE
jgi:hypothetical protein